MPTQEERLFIVEQTLAILRSDFLQAIVSNTSSLGAINKVLAQQEVNTRDADHEITILLGVVAAQGKDIKAIKNRLDGFDQRFASVEERFASVEEHFASVEEHFASVEEHFASVEEHFASVEEHFASVEEHFASVEEHFASVDGKLDQILLVLGTLAPKTGQET